MADNEFEWYNGTVWVTVYEAKGLAAADSGGTSDPYVVVNTGPNGAEGGAVKTKVVKKTLNPEWVEQFELQVKHETHVTLDVKDKDRFTSDDPLGSVSIPIRSLLHTNKFQQWLALDQGALLVAVWFRPTVDMEAALVGVDLPNLINRSFPETERPIPEVVIRLTSIIRDGSLSSGAFGTADTEAVELARERLEGGHGLAVLDGVSPAVAYDLLGLIFEWLTTPLLANTFYDHALTTTEANQDSVVGFIMENANGPAKYILQYIAKFLRDVSTASPALRDDMVNAWADVLLRPSDYVHGDPAGMPDEQGRRAFVSGLIATIE